jgi:hypothetical protein
MSGRLADTIASIVASLFFPVLIILIVDCTARERRKSTAVPVGAVAAELALQLAWAA